MNDKLLSALSLCRKAGRLKMGGDVVREEIMKGGARLVLLASDAAERTVRQMRFAPRRGRRRPNNRSRESVPTPR